MHHHGIQAPQHTTSIISNIRVGVVILQMTKGVRRKLNLSIQDRFNLEIKFVGRVRTF